jgi:hypothetical protein
VVVKDTGIYLTVKRYPIPLVALFQAPANEGVQLGKRADLIDVRVSLGLAAAR